MTKKELKSFIAGLGIKEAGISPAKKSLELEQILKNARSKMSPCPFEEADEQKRVDPTLLLKDAASIITCLFPYYIKDFEPDNLSRYAHLRDYHAVAIEKLEQIAEHIRGELGAECLCFCDNGPLCDRYLAYCAGLGFYGENHMLINPRLGSYFFIGSVITTAEFEPDKPLDATCMKCGKCKAACPGGALSDDVFCYEKCISYITQAKSISKEQEAILCSQNKVYGCDVCQEVCPHNAGLSDTAMKEFLACRLTVLPEFDIMNMSNREFQKKYGKFPFSWRGRKVLARNLQQKELDKIGE